MSSLPQIIRENGFEFHWDERDVWTLDVPIESLPLSELAWHFDVPFWDDVGGSYNLTPRAVMAAPDNYPHHKQRIEHADIAYALDICMHPKTQRWVLLDGLHRLVRLAQMGEKSVRVRKITLAQFQSLPSFKLR